MAFRPTVDVLNIVCRSLKVTGCVVALGDEDVVIDAALQWPVEWDWWSHELLFDSSKAFKARCELKMMVRVCFRYCGDNGNVVTFGADVVGA